MENSVIEFRETLEPVAPGELRLDPLNPRLAGGSASLKQQALILGTLWRERSVNEIVDSILVSGFWPHEELFAVRELGQLVVIEGNRRLAAVKVLTDETLRKAAKIPKQAKPRAKVAKTLEQLPVVVSTRKKVWEYIGFKHVNGPQEWDSVAKAEYIARVRNDFKVSPQRIAETIGDRHDTVRRLYRGLMVLRQAEASGGFSREDSYRKRFPFSHLWTALGYTNTRKFLGITASRLDTKTPVPKAKLKDLGALCGWLYGSRKDEVAPLVRSQNPYLRLLQEALGDERGVAALRLGHSIDMAVQVSRGDERLLREALVTAETSIRQAKGYFATGFSGQSDLDASVKSIAVLANSLLDELTRRPKEPTTPAKRSVAKRRAR